MCHKATPLRRRARKVNFGPTVAALTSRAKGPYLRQLFETFRERKQVMSSWMPAINVGEKATCYYCKREMTVVKGLKFSRHHDKEKKWCWASGRVITKTLFKYEFPLSA